ncbi:MAG: flagellin [Planctomycetota bacterium]
MSRINTNIQSLIAQRSLSTNNATLNTSLERLSTGLRINRGSDDPAGLIASESLRSEKVAIAAAIDNAERADQVVNVAEGGLQEINAQLLELQSLIGQTANDTGLSEEEKEANQQQVDSILATIDRIASSTTFNGTKLLNGSLDFTVSNQSTSLSDFQINNASLPANGGIEVDAAITASAQVAGLFLSFGDDLALDDDADSVFSFELAGTLGSRSFSFTSGTTVETIATAINTYTDVLGISATTDTGGGDNGIFINSTELGSDAFVSIDVTSVAGQGGDGVLTLCATDADVADDTSATAFTAVTNAIRDEGQDVAGSINGVKFRGDGADASIASDTLNLEVTLSSSAYESVGTVSLFDIAGGGAKFNLGPTVDIINEVRLGIGAVNARGLASQTLQDEDGDDYAASLADLGSGGNLDLLDGNLTDAQTVVNDAINEVSRLRGRLGSFQSNVIGSTINALSVTLENVSAAESSIRDTDFAAETAELTRAQILQAAATNSLSIANSAPSAVLGLLG